MIEMSYWLQITLIDIWSFLKFATQPEMGREDCVLVFDDTIQEILSLLMSPSNMADSSVAVAKPLLLIN